MSELLKLLLVLIGYKGKDDIVYLNFYEKVYGLYGLFVGIMGLGKSEFF